MNAQINKCSVFSSVVQWCINQATRTLAIQSIDSFSNSTTSTKVLPNDHFVHIAMHHKKNLVHIKVPWIITTREIMIMRSDKV
jgi:hypothetical protein